MFKSFDGGLRDVICSIVDVVKSLVEMFSRKKDQCGEIPRTSVTLAQAVEKGYNLQTHHYISARPNVMIRNGSRFAQAAQVISRDEFIDSIFRIWPKLQKQPLGMATRLFSVVEQ
jgi:hypothetical protein